MRGINAGKHYLGIYVRHPNLSRSNILTLLVNKLGIEVDPSDVRTNPKRKDPYSWKVLCGQEEVFSQIFSKNLSEHSIGTYRLLIDEVGKTFEAVSTDTHNFLGVLTPVCINEPQYLCNTKPHIAFNP